MTYYLKTVQLLQHLASLRHRRAGGQAGRGGEAGRCIPLIRCDKSGGGECLASVVCCRWSRRPVVNEAFDTAAAVDRSFTDRRRLFHNNAI